MRAELKYSIFLGELRNFPHLSLTYPLSRISLIAPGQVAQNLEAEGFGRFVLVSLRNNRTRTTVIYLAVGALTAVAMSLLGMPTPRLWGGVAFALHFIPFLGPVITFLVLCMVSVISFDTWVRILLPPLVYLVLAMVEGYLVTPIILGRRLTLNPIMVFVAFLFWGWMWGVPGIFLAVPILTGLKIICDDIEWLKPAGQVVGSEKTRNKLFRKRIILP